MKNNSGCGILSVLGALLLFPLAVIKELTKKYK